MSKQIENLEFIIKYIPKLEYWEQIEVNKKINILIHTLNRNEPMRPIHIKQLTYSCPNCNHEQHTVGNNYCNQCGQKLDWGGEYE